MADLEYTVTNQGISTSKTSRLVSGTIGVYTVKFTFNNVWDGLEKWATFDPIPGTPYKQPLDANGECTIPGEVMGGVYLRIGVFGLAEGQAYPTIWASKLPLEEGCFVNVPPSDWPEPSPIIEEIMEELETKVDKPDEVTPGNVAIFDTNRNIADSGVSKDNLILAPQLASNNYKTDRIPYIYRQTGGGIGVGNREYDSIVGGSVVYNQVFERPSNGTYNQVTIANVDGQTIILSGTASSTIYRPSLNAYKTIIGHVYFAEMYKSDESTDDTYFYNDSGGVRASLLGSISKATASKVFYLRINSGGNFGDGMTMRGMIVDLTVAFGSAVAEQLHTLFQSDPTTARAFVHQFFKNDVSHAFNTGTLESVSGLQSHKLTGFNLWDEEWQQAIINASGVIVATGSNYLASKNFIPVFPNTTYQIKIPSNTMYVFEYTADGTYLRNMGGANGSTFTASADCYKIRFYLAYAVPYKGNICINISDPARNGTYEPYEEHTYPLDDSLTLRGVAILDDNGNIKFDGDLYHSDGTVDRRYGILDLGTLNWIYASSASDTRFYTTSIACNAPTSTAVTVKAVCALYAAMPYNQVNGQVSNDMVMGAVKSGGTVYFAIKNLSYTSAAAFKTAMSGVYLIYELATPTTETAEPYDSLQICDPLGTEEYVTTGIVPVGHETRYPENQVAKLDGLPSDFSRIIAPTEIEFKATRTYTVGRLMIIHNVLYKAKTSIAIGATLTVGTNIEETTLDEVIASL